MARVQFWHTDSNHNAQVANDPHFCLSRHVHKHAYAALVLSGGYEEAVIRVAIAYGLEMW